MAVLEPPRTPRTYGNWRRPASAGLGTLGTLGTGVLVGGLVVVIGTMMVAGLLPALVLAALIACFLGLLAVRDRHGLSVLKRTAVLLGWGRTRLAGTELYRSGPLGHTEWGTFQLPGLAAGSRLSEWADSYGRRFALLHVPAAGHYTAVLVAEPDGASLVDAEQVDSWVAHWGGWLASLGNEPGLVAASVTVETAPDSGARLRRQVATAVDPDAPTVAQAVLRELVETYPAGSATIRASIALTFAAAPRRGGRRRDAGEMARDLATRLPGLTQRLHATGAGAARPMSAQELCETVRIAYDPPAARLIDAARAERHVPELSWSQVGPTAQQASWDALRHDGAWSVSWSMTSAPRGEVYSSVLTQLLAPHPNIDRKRVTLLYRPLNAARAAHIVEQDKRNAEFKVSSTQRPSARALSEQRSTAATAEEEARGAGLVNFGMVVTATVADAGRLADARAAVDHLAATARVQLRPVYGSQDSAFAAGLPLGLVLPEHLNVPTSIRNSL